MSDENNKRYDSYIDDAASQSGEVISSAPEASVTPDVGSDSSQTDLCSDSCEVREASEGYTATADVQTAAEGQTHADGQTAPQRQTCEDGQAYTDGQTGGQTNEQICGQPGTQAGAPYSQAGAQTGVPYGQAGAQAGVPYGQNPYSYNAAPQQSFGTFYGQVYGAAQNGYQNSYQNGYQNYAPAMSAPARPMPAVLKYVVLSILCGLLALGSFLGGSYIVNRFYPISKIGRSSEKKQTEEVVDAEVAITADPVEIAPTKIADSVSTLATDVSSVVEAVMPSIVQINCTFLVSSYWYGTYEATGAGSGILLRKSPEELLIATNNHVVEDAVSITITFIDGTTAPAVIKGNDSVADLAVVAVKLTDVDPKTEALVKAAKLGDSAEVKVGQMAIAIGNAMGYGQSTTVGYISANEREVVVEKRNMVLIQTDAAINPGNSGGALLNIKGEVIGINSVKFASEEVEGMGFAIPISRALSILEELAEREVLNDEEKGYLGVYLQNVTDEVAEVYNWPVGVYISEVVEGLAAEKAGILVGDIITAVNGATVTNADELKARVTAHRYGEEITLTVQRRVEGEFKEFTITVLLGKNPEYDK